MSATGWLIVNLCTCIRLYIRRNKVVRPDLMRTYNPENQLPSSIYKLNLCSTWKSVHWIAVHSQNSQLSTLFSVVMGSNIVLLAIQSQLQRSEILILRIDLAHLRYQLCDSHRLIQSGKAEERIQEKIGNTCTWGAVEKQYPTGVISDELPLWKYTRSLWCLFLHYS